MVKDILTKLSDTNSSKEKELILASATPEQKLFFQKCYNPRVSYGIKKIPEFNNTNGQMTITEAVLFLEKFFETREYTGNLAIEKLKELLEASAEADTLTKLINRNAECGVNVKMLNKVFGKSFIQEIPCMLANPYNEKNVKAIQYPAIAQEKADGMRCIIIIESNRIDFFTRNGTPLNLPHIENLLRNFNKENSYKYNGILDGEILAIKDNVILPRQISNGLCNKLICQTIPENELELLGLQLWDFVENEADATLYTKRFEKVKEIVKNLNASNITLIDYKIVNNLAEAKEFNKEKLSQEKEGIILKNLNSKWENKRSKHLVKFKEELTCDLLVVDVIEGNGEMKGGVGALVCETSCGKLRVNVGSGLSMTDRGLEIILENGKKSVRNLKDFDTLKNEFLGKVVEVMYNSVIKSKGDDKESLFLPRFLKVRKDKDVANKREDF